MRNHSVGRVVNVCQGLSGSRGAMTAEAGGTLDGLTLIMVLRVYHAPGTIWYGHTNRELRLPLSPLYR